MSPLERRYRRLLAILPAAYRAAWEEEMVTTFLAGMHTDDPERAEYLADYGRPSWSEAASVAALAIRLRLPGSRPRLSGTASPRAVVWGDAVRLVALIGLLVHASSAAGTVLHGLWLAGRTPWPPPPEADFILHSAFFRVGVAVSVVWVPAYVALLFGGRRTALLLALGGVLATYGAHVLNPIQPFTLSTAAFAAFDLFTVAALAGFHRDAPPIRRRPWLLALPAGLAADLALGLIIFSRGERALPVLDWPAFCCVVAATAAAVHLGRRSRVAPSWTLALVMLTAAALVLRLLTLADYAWMAPDAQRPVLVVLGVAEALAVLAAAVPLTLLAVHSLRRRPAPAPGTPL